MRGDDEKQTRERERDTRDDRSSGAQPELRDLRRGEPDPSEQDEQESDFRKAHARVMRQSEDVHGWILPALLHPCRGRSCRHYNGQRPHRSRQLRPPRPDHPIADLSKKRIKHRPVLGGLLNEYERAA